jgi:hypothetical protein
MSHVNVNPDSLPLLAPAGIKRSSSSPLSSPTDKRPKPELPDHILPQEQLEAFNVKMQQRSILFYSRVSMEACTIGEWKGLLSDVLMYISDRLHATDLRTRTSVISPTQAEELVKAFTHKQLGEWKDAMKRGVEKNDWTEVISLCKYLSKQMVGSR